MTDEQKVNYPIGYEVTHTNIEEYEKDSLYDNLSSPKSHFGESHIKRIVTVETLSEITHHCKDETIGIIDHLGNEEEVPLELIRLTKESKQLLERSRNLDDLS